MKKYSYKAPYSPYLSYGPFKNKKAVAAFIRKIDSRYKHYTTKTLISLWQIEEW